MRLCWSHMPHCWKSHVMAHFSFCFQQFMLGSQTIDIALAEEAVFVIANTFLVTFVTC